LLTAIGMTSSGSIKFTTFFSFLTEFIQKKITSFQTSKVQTGSNFIYP